MNTQRCWWLLLQKWRSARKAAVNFSVPIRTVFQPAGDVTVTMTAMTCQMKLAVVSSIIIIIRPRRSRSAAAYSHQTFPCTICRSVGPSVCLSSALWKNGRSQPAAVRHHRSDGSTDEAGIGVWQAVHGKGYFWGRIWTAPL